jgi:hypothetical protein
MPYIQPSTQGITHVPSEISDSPPPPSAGTKRTRRPSRKSIEAQDDDIELGSEIALERDVVFEDAPPTKKPRGRAKKQVVPVEVEVAIPVSVTKDRRRGRSSVSVQEIETPEEGVDAGLEDEATPVCGYCIRRPVLTNDRPLEREERELQYQYRHHLHLHYPFLPLRDDELLTRRRRPLLSRSKRPVAVCLVRQNQKYNSWMRSRRRARRRMISRGHPRAVASQRHPESLERNLHSQITIRSRAVVRKWQIRLSATDGER